MTLGGREGGSYGHVDGGALDCRQLASFAVRTITSDDAPAQCSELFLPSVCLVATHRIKSDRVTSRRILSVLSLGAPGRPGGGAASHLGGRLRHHRRKAEESD